MAIQVLKEGTRMNGFTPAQNVGNTAPQVILAGSVVEIDPADTTGNTIRLYVSTDGTPAGVALESNVRSTVTNQTPGAQYVTEYNRGGLVSFMYGSTGLVTVSQDALNDPFSTDVASTGAFTVNKPIYVKNTVAHADSGVGQLSGLNTAATQIGIVTKITGTYTAGTGNLAVTFKLSL